MLFEELGLRIEAQLGVDTVDRPGAVDVAQAVVGQFYVGRWIDCCGRKCSIDLESGTVVTQGRSDQIDEWFWRLCFSSQWKTTELQGNGVFGHKNK